MIASQPYTLHYIDSVLQSGFYPTLSQSVIDMLTTLEAELQIPDETSYVATNNVATSSYRREKHYDTHFSTHGHSNGHGHGHGQGAVNNDRRKYGNGGNNGNRRGKQRETSSAEWDAIMAVSSSMPKKDVEGLEKDLNTIRTLLNKVSTKNYETQKVALHDAIQKYIVDANDSEEDIHKLFKTMIDIVGTNKFFSELYATLFKDWFESFTQLRTLWENQFEAMIHSIDDIQCIDPNVDYDGYCNCTKINDKRKSYTTFIANLYKKDALSCDSVCQTIEYYLQKTMEYIDQPGRANEVEEITENTHIIAILVNEKMQSNERWQKNVVNKLIELSQMKMKEHASLSNRALFKYMDIVEHIDL